MTDQILNITVVVVGRVTSWPRNLPVGHGRGLLAQRHGRYVAGNAGHHDRTPPELAAILAARRGIGGNIPVIRADRTRVWLTTSGDGASHQSKALHPREKSTYHRRPARPELSVQPTNNPSQHGREPGRTTSPCPPPTRRSPRSAPCDHIGGPPAHGTSRQLPEPATTAGRG